MDIQKQAKAFAIMPPFNSVTINQCAMKGLQMCYRCLNTMSQDIMMGQVVTRFSVVFVFVFLWNRVTNFSCQTNCLT